MDYAQLLNEVKLRSDEEVRIIARQYDIDLSLAEIRALRPLLDEISFHWLFTGVPETFISKVRAAIGDSKTELLFNKYINASK
ncbi:hypothetical protein FITA111629_04780 [Filibacter tadaridae]|uniref:Uncharacterized protein n=1 Tax=Filibacter tadaridae TaxID=2483811 RepID=A0A3P5XC89_9BACL|nr:hypothetical protein [Filibacter tadaridae]VDC32448.1 hypothetical protein FILTAD_02676 [Filibacter tadaridae]